MWPAPLRKRTVLIEGEGAITVYWSKWWWTAYMRARDWNKRHFELRMGGGR